MHSNSVKTSVNEEVNNSLNYKDVSTLSSFVNEQGKILPRRLTGLKSKQQKRVTKLIKQARIAALLPFVIGKN
uniref:Small ribosomal subunit protein bS18c n=2 Tax=Isochrysidaceae TaxID=418951 RepID=A0A3Q8CFT0_9EUKA|nr:ribosomal protein S18 [Tisochrysis lutea]YP_009873591.1 ribosomal protein S18 [Isochrysis galbana]AUM82506.1 ribosomal protein S18 [Tisochrysis lutea]QKW88474.1 ribosomal protein S18 [Isochrysis galbana]